MAEGDLTGTWRNYQIAAGAVGFPELGAGVAAALAGGFRYTYSTDVEATDPGAGKLKFDKATLSEAIALRISETDADGNALAAWLATLDDSTNAIKGTIILRKVGEPKAFAIFNVSGALVDNGTWDSIAVTYVLSVGLANNDEVILDFIRAGDKGAEGGKGEKGEKGATGATGPAGGALERDSVAESAAGTGTLEWEHPFVDSNDVQGVLVLIVANDTTPSDEVTAVTISGVALDEVPGSPFLHSEGSEDGVIYAYFLGKGLPEPGGGFMKVTVSGATSKKAVSIAIKADRNLRVEDTGSQDSSATTKPTASLTIGHNECLLYSAVHSGLAAPAGITPVAPATKIAEHDFGEASAAWFEKLDQLGPASREISAEQASDEAGTFGVAIGRVRDFGLVSALPSVAGVGDVCRFYADKANGVIWDLVYDGEGEFPWKKIGGPPLRAVDAGGERKTSSNVFQTTGSPSVSTPLAGDYRVKYGAKLVLSETAEFNAMRVGVFAAGVEKDTSVIGGDGFCRLPSEPLSVLAALAKATSIQTRYRSDSSKATAFFNLVVEVDPTRVG